MNTSDNHKLITEPVKSIAEPIEPIEPITEENKCYYIVLNNYVDKYKTKATKTNINGMKLLINQLMYYNGDLSSINDYINQDSESLQTTKTQSAQFAYYEVLRDRTRRFYIDIENVEKPKSSNKNIKHLFIIDLVSKLKDFIGIPQSTMESITYNNNSDRHEGLSYHIYLPFKVDKSINRKILISFIHKYPEYAHIIDLSVYDHYRFFRLPYSYSILDSEFKSLLALIGGRHAKKQIEESKYHRQYLDENGDPVEIEGNINTESYHKIIKGTISSCIIQNVSQLPDLPISQSIQIRLQFLAPIITKNNCKGSIYKPNKRNIRNLILYHLPSRSQMLNNHITALSVKKFDNYDDEFLDVE